MFGALSAAFGAGALLGALIQAARARASWKALLLGATVFSSGLVVLAPIQTVALAGFILFVVGVGFHRLGLEHERPAPASVRPTGCAAA